jgi:hypothetical protein
VLLSFHDYVSYRDIPFCFCTESDSVIDISGLSTHGSFSNEPFLTLEPPLSESDYSFSLGDGEGMSDLFDFEF